MAMGIAMAMLLTLPALQPRSWAAANDEIPITANEKAAALLEQAFDAAENFETASATDLFKQALGADPTSVTAQFFVGLNTPATDKTNAAIDATLAKAGKLPAAERLLLENRAANFRFDIAKVLSTATALVAKVPKSARAHALLAEAYGLSDQSSKALGELRKALELKPEYAIAYNGLGGIALNAERFDEAVAMFTKYAAIRPRSPNSQDSLGAALMAAGRVDDAAKAFNKATSIDPSFAFAYEGIALAKFFKGDSTGALASMRTYVEKSPDPPSRAAAQIDVAYLATAARDTAAAERALDDSIATMQGDTYWPVLIGALRGSVRVYAGKYAEAVKVLTPLQQSIKALNVPASQRQGLEILRLYWLARAQGALGQADAAAASATAAAAVAKASPGDKVRADQASIAAWAAALAKGDAKAALAAVANCNNCKPMLAIAQERAGQQASAAKTRAFIRTHTYRSAEGALVWSQTAA